MISVILPNYNHAKYMRQRIESILNQTYQHFELIILDDCSTDNSREIIEEYRNHPKVSKIIYNETNSGQIVKQWRLGLQHALGDYIWIAESDDYSDYRFLEEQFKLIQSNANCGLVFCNSNIVNEKDEIIGSMENWKNELFKIDRWNYSYTNQGKVELFQYVIHACTINNLSACLFIKSAFVKALYKIHEAKYTVDWLLYMIILYNYDVIYNNNKLNFYRDHALNASKSNNNYSGGFIDRFATRLNFYRTENFTREENKILFKNITSEYRGILGGIKRHNININAIIKVHKNIKNPFLFFRILMAVLYDKARNPFTINDKSK